jgi:hypothetical protein
MQNHSRCSRGTGNRTLIAQGSAALFAFTLMLGVAARGVQSLPNVHAQSDRAGYQEAGGQEVEAEVFTGTIVRDGTVLVFRDQSGKVYRLNAPEKAHPFEGKPVRLTGKLEKDTGLLLVNRIENAEH